MGNTAGHRGQEKEKEIDNERIPTDFDAANYLLYIFQDAAAIGGRQIAVNEWSPVLTRPRVVKLMKWCGCSGEWWNRLPSGKSQFS